MHVNIARRIAAERSLSLLTMTNRTRHSALRTYRQSDFGELYISWYSAQFLSLPYTSFTKSIFEFEVLNANTSRLAPCRIRLEMCAEMKEEAQAHYFRTILILAILIKV